MSRDFTFSGPGASPETARPRRPRFQRRPSDHDGERGFTLLEILVALVVIGMVFVTLNDGVRFGFHARLANANRDQQVTELEAISRTLRLLLLHATPGDQALPADVFIGSAHTVSFITRLPDESGNPQAVDSDVTLAVGAGHQLELRARPHYRRWIVPPPPPAVHALMDRVERLEFSYWQAPANGAGGVWVTAWQGAALPRLVRVRVVFPPGDKRHWPDLIISPRRTMLQP